MPLTRRPRAHHRVNLYLGARRQMKQKFSDHDETSLSIAAVSAPSVACCMLAVQQQKRLLLTCLLTCTAGCDLQSLQHRFEQDGHYVTLQGTC